MEIFVSLKLDFFEELVGLKENNFCFLIVLILGMDPNFIIILSLGEKSSPIF